MLKQRDVIIKNELFMDKINDKYECYTKLYL